MYKLSDIAYEQGDYWVLKVVHGYDVYKIGITHSSRCAQIGYTGQIGLDKAICEITRRLAK
jgi:hypothetical protein